jgi:hypothetical protein
MTGLKENWRNLAVGCAWLMLGAAFLYYAGEYLPAQEALRQAEERAAQERQRASLDACLTAVQRTHRAHWERDCTRLREPADCALPRDLADYWTDWRQTQKEGCVNRYHHS